MARMSHLDDCSGARDRGVRYPAEDRFAGIGYGVNTSTVRRSKSDNGREALTDATKPCGTRS